VVTNLAKIFFTQSEQRCPVELGVTPYTIVGMRMQIFAIAVPPDLFGLVLAIDIHCAWAPIVLLARHEVPTLKQQNPLPGRSQAIGERPSACAGPDNDDVKLIKVWHAILFCFSKESCANFLFIPRGHLLLSHAFPFEGLSYRQGPECSSARLTSIAIV
jgi:hypothetical protein